MDKKEKIYQQMRDNASEQDVRKIASKLSGMNRGKFVLLSAGTHEQVSVFFISLQHVNRTQYRERSRIRK